MNNDDIAKKMIDAVMSFDPIHDGTASELARLAADGYANVKRASAELDGAKKLLAGYERRLAEAMKREGVSQVQVETNDGKTTVFRKDAFYASCLADERPALIEWLRANGQGELVKEEVNAATLKKHVKELMEGGQETPPMVKITIADEIGYRRT